MLDNILRQQTLTSVSRYRSMQQTLGESCPKDILYNADPASTKDIFGQDKQKLKVAETSRYFQCENCGRNIAGGRLAQHTTKCLERKRR